MQNLVEICGYISLAYVGFKVLRVFSSCFRSLFKSEKLNALENDYAIVTGSTDGIGLEYARQLAQRGFNLFLLSRNKDKLKKVAEEIRSVYPQCREIEILDVDFSLTTIYDDIEKKIKEIKQKGNNITVLVNNVGFLHPVPEFFIDYPKDHNLKSINVNIVSMTLMCQIVAPLMVEQKRGFIINISSYAGCSPLPVFTIYSATKAYMNQLSLSLVPELKKYGVILQTVTPNQVHTKMSSRVREKNVEVSAKSMVQYSLNTVGKELITHGHPLHTIMNNLLLVFDQFMTLDFGLYVKYKIGISIREKAKKFS